MSGKTDGPSFNPADGASSSLPSQKLHSSMPLRPFPLPISIGTDICSINRVRAIISKGDNNFKAYLRRFLTPREQRDVHRRHGVPDLTDPNTLNRISHFLAGRWAAKEATIKAVKWRKISFHDIIIQSSPYGHGHVHAIILDDPAWKASQSKIARGFLNLDNESTHGSRACLADSSSRSQGAADEQISPIKHTKLDTAIEQTDRNGRDTAPLHARHAEGTTGEDRPPGNDAEELSGQIAQVSISHDSDYATAVCLAAQELADGDMYDKLAARNP